jgi:hypothetical protein
MVEWITSPVCATNILYIPYFKAKLILLSVVFSSLATKFVIN